MDTVTKKGKKKKDLTVYEISKRFMNIQDLSEEKLIREMIYDLTDNIPLGDLKKHFDVLKIEISGVTAFSATMKIKS